MTLRVIRDVLAEVVAARADDPALRLLDGLDLYGPGDAEADPLPDQLHPSPSADEMIGRRFARLGLGVGS